MGPSAKPEFDIDTSTGQQHWRQGQGPAWEASRVGQGASWSGCELTSGVRVDSGGLESLKVHESLTVGWGDRPTLAERIRRKMNKANTLSPFCLKYGNCSKSFFIKHQTCTNMDSCCRIRTESVQFDVLPIFTYRLGGGYVLFSTLFLTALSLYFIPSFWNNSATVREGVTKFEMPRQKLLNKCLFLFIAPFDL